MYKQDISNLNEPDFLDFEDRQPIQPTRYQPYQQIPHSIYEREYYTKPNNDIDYQMLKNMIEFKKYMELTGRLESDGVITIKKPIIEVEEKERELTPGKFLIMLGILVVIGISI